MRENWLSNRIFRSYDDIVDHCCHAWNKLIDQPWRIMSIGMSFTGAYAQHNLAFDTTNLDSLSAVSYPDETAVFRMLEYFIGSLSKNGAYASVVG